ncbi:acyl-CoA synthetase [Rhodococcus sp. X156]|uniref:acyl-CoA synthetase n=1 Tax=Rhodococcus sp. X156 TaxID=2499145 RepID=UPI000FD9F238|nr:acyl-CoA synthetase [Rhodococcus sp. X156]
MPTLPQRVLHELSKVTDPVHNIAVMQRAGLVNLTRPDHTLASMVAFRRLGPVAGAAVAAAARVPDAVALVDERRSLTYRELDLRTNALARAWGTQGITAGSVVAVLCRDHAGLVEAMIATAKIGARLLLMNTGFSAPQLADVAQREGVTAIVCDQEFAGLLAELPESVLRFLAWTDEARPELSTVEELISSTDSGPVPRPAQVGGLVLLTSGTTGTPKGAPRQVRSPLASAHFLERIPLRRGEATFLAAPIFHGTGLSQFLIMMGLGSTTVVRRRFDAEATLAAVARHRCTALVLVPTMLQRILDLGPEVLARHDTSCLRIIFTAGSALSPALGERATAEFGEVIHNLYGSTEVAVATVATPADWRAAPGTVGRPPHGCTVKLFDAEGHEVTAPHTQGRIFAGSGLAFGGYTGGGHKELIDGLLSSGDVGHFDEEGRLFVDGRDDDMIVSGGENVFPLEIENLLVQLPGVVDAAVVAVGDVEFGQRLRAFVVRAEDSSLDEDQVRAHVKSNLARYKVPRDVVFLDELPRNPTGKLLRRALAEMPA